MSHYLFTLCLILICALGGAFGVAWNHLFGAAGLPVMVLGSFAIGWFGASLLTRVDRKLRAKRAHLEAK